MKYSVSAVAFASLAAHAAAQGCNVKYDTSNQAGNPITAPVNSIVPAGTPFTIKWTATDKSLPVAIELLRGPSTNVLPIQCLTSSAPNNGEFVWTPSSALEGDVTGYGLRIIVLNAAGTGSFQYSTQFGVSNDVVHGPTSSSASIHPGTTSVRPTSDASTISSAEISSISSSSLSSVFTTSIAANTTTATIPVATVPVVTASANSSSVVVIATTHIPIPIPSSGALQTLTVLQPTNNMTVPASLKTSKTQAPSGVTASASATSVETSTGSPISGPGTVPSDNGAGKMMAGSMLAALAAMGAFLL